MILREDIRRLSAMYGNEDKFDLRALIRHAKELDESQFSDYSVQEATAFWNMFNFEKDYDVRVFADKLKNNSYEK